MEHFQDLHSKTTLWSFHSQYLDSDFKVRPFHFHFHSQYLDSDYDMNFKVRPFHFQLKPHWKKVWVHFQPSMNIFPALNLDFKAEQ